MNVLFFVGGGKELEAVVRYDEIQILRIGAAVPFSAPIVPDPCWIHALMTAEPYGRRSLSAPQPAVSSVSRSVQVVQQHRP